MKKIFLFVVLGLAFTACHKNNDTIVLNDNFSNPLSWQTQGSGVTVSNGTCNFTNAYNGSINRVYQSLSTTLPDNYWKAKCKFSILSANPSGHGTTESVIVLTQGTLDYYSSQNGIGVFLTSGPNNPTDNNINDWYFVIQGDCGGTYSSLSTGIYASASISNYYIQVERTSSSMVQLSIFSDSTFTTPLPGSPVTLAINSAITGLNTVQHASCAIGSTSRMISSATVDNDLIRKN